MPPLAITAWLLLTSNAVIMLAMRRDLLCNPGIRLITWELSAVPSCSQMGIRFIQREGWWEIVNVKLWKSKTGTYWSHILPLSENLMWQLIDKGLLSYYYLIFDPVYLLLFIPASFFSTINSFPHFSPLLSSRRVKFKDWIKFFII